MSEPQYVSPSKFDKMIGELENLPDVTKAGPSTVVSCIPLIGATITVIVQTIRQAEKGDTIFLQHVDDTGAIRIVLPPKVADMIARQRDSLTVKVRKKIGRASAAARKARGELPGFMKNPSRRKKSPKGGV